MKSTPDRQPVDTGSGADDLNPQVVEKWCADLAVCSVCGDLSGKITHPHKRVSAWQDCRCTRRPPSQMWALHGLMFHGQLCECCGQVLLAMRSKFSVWFCKGCMSQVRWLNARLGRYAVPIGGHSLHGGFALGGDAPPVDIEIFADRWTHITDAMNRLTEWSGEVVRRVIAERLPDAPTRIPIERYLAVCVDEDEEKMRRFREMMEFLVSDAEPV